MPDSLSARAFRKLGYRGLEVARCEVLENPEAPWLVHYFGGRQTLRFRDGFRFDASRATLDLAEKLIALAYDGATFRREGAPDGFSWLVDEPGGVIVTPTGLRFALESLHPAIFAETFLYDIHFHDFDLSGRVVIDIGSNVGDTPLYFAQRGAEVFAYEPDPANFALLEKNLALNPDVARRIHRYPKAAGSDGTVAFQVGLGGGSGRFAVQGRTVRVPSVSLATILREEGASDPYLLKADAKGSEFELVRQPEMARFPRALIEYTADAVGESPQRLLDALRAAGLTKIRAFKHNFGYYPLVRHGTLWAER